MDGYGRVPYQVTLPLQAEANSLSAEYNNFTDMIDEIEKPPRWQAWLIGLAFITLCSFTAPIGLAILPCLKKIVYDRIMAFLIALGIGTLSGSCMFIMIPEAFNLTTIPGLDYEPKSVIIVSSLYAFFIVDRLLQYFLEYRRRRSSHRKIHASTFRKIMEKLNGTRKSSSERNPTIETTVEDPQEKEDRQAIKDEVEVAVLNNAIMRSFSKRRQIAVVEAVDDIEYRDDRHREHKDEHKVSNNNNNNNNDTFVKEINDDISHLKLPQYNSNTASVKEDDEVSINVQIVEKKVIDKAEMEVASIAYIIVLGSSANNFLDAMSMGTAFSSSLMRGVTLGISSYSQQLPQEIGTLAILVNAGLGVRRTLLVNLIPAATSYAGFIVGMLLNNADGSYAQYVFSVSAGMYLYVFLGTLVPEIRENTEQMIRTNLRESILYTVFQFFGIAGGITFIFFMNRMNENAVSA